MNYDMICRSVTGIKRVILINNRLAQKAKLKKNHTIQDKSIILELGVFKILVEFNKRHKYFLVFS